MSAEKLPQGFERLPSLSLRVRIRKNGHEPISRLFPLSVDTVDDRKRQLQEAKAWVEEVRRKIPSGMSVNTREAEKMSLGDALLRYSREGLDGKKKNVGKDLNRVDSILSDPISRRAIAGLRKTDLAAFRDRLIQEGWARSVAAAIKKLGEKPENRKRVAALRDLPRLHADLGAAGSAPQRIAIEAAIAEVEEREDVRKPARTTIANKTQLITRALAFMSDKIEGVPDLSGLALPAASPGRTRRATSDELKRLSLEASKVNPILPLVIDFAIETCLRKERILEFSDVHIEQIGGGAEAIVFPKSKARRKRTGIVPITARIRSIIAEVAYIRSRDTQKPIFDININTFDNQWQKAIKLAEIEDFTFHDLRHEGTSRLFEAGLTTAEVMSVTGHSTVDMVDRYSHYSAYLVFKKLEKGIDQDSLLAELGFLFKQFKSVGGDVKQVFALLDR